MTLPLHLSAQPRRRLRDLLAPALHGVKTIAAKAITPHRAAMSNLKQIPLTVLGTSSIDFSAFHAGHGFGWLVTGVSLLVIEHLIADETP